MGQSEMFTDRSRQDEILDAFATFHRENPGIFVLFCRFAFDLIDAGKTRYSADAVLHRIRWHVSIETTGEELKLNNNFAAYYGRLFEIKHPEHQGFFERRRCLSATRPATGNGMVYHSGKPNEQREADISLFLHELLVDDERE